jgi:hypothetical protein
MKIRAASFGDAEHLGELSNARRPRPPSFPLVSSGLVVPFCKLDLGTRPARRNLAHLRASVNFLIFRSASCETLAGLRRIHVRSETRVPLDRRQEAGRDRSLP